ncbi:unnamed protein product [Vitrella brassicaformis CCMP3155]|uniref:t-SNARE coiled-coil homology domain-containing protein n=1 Tax=Vitrella brassicaformis (strain CCMP3155) TaxID=1169540 RepID=A0A0G4G7Y9_VITBC|nr:unnamed protein product [Vitrella brassicaformis CCMP3155]|eukprot:CEM24738.1 unnamed protein product [Vitrella brassicaformis CCMP3155]
MVCRFVTLLALVLCASSTHAIDTDTLLSHTASKARAKTEKTRAAIDEQLATMPDPVPTAMRADVSVKESAATGQSSVVHNDDDETQMPPSMRFMQTQSKLRSRSKIIGDENVHMEEPAADSHVETQVLEERRAERLRLAELERQEEADKESFQNMLSMQNMQLQRLSDLSASLGEVGRQVVQSNRIRAKQDQKAGSKVQIIQYENQPQENHIDIRQLKGLRALLSR